ncbi:mitochondrial ribosomal protein S14 precursor, putative [Babesia microti strain RI]|uniref:Mitochondrial ribosomal protein S14, putative n=1 Tax=Babesia microti (strain RI) TaxID=1133968 RepID=I7J9A6_BABMR|nr:mitochondrial ribosomal protein S14 precursor, putative [Babesia microti strain RI]CCF75788.1 mitochondrial ribosomal protein S14 precursor, putative [Babesia microti strain RI]|eukprot:XP_012650196.1 mitochondrial ribosomal protein S14 precursor, putative [Babesia microti strain RI]
MAARNPGPTLNKEPLGFPTYHNKCKRDYLSRRLFLESEVNTRIYKNIYHNLGLKGAIPIDSKTGYYLIRKRCIQNGYARGVFKLTRMAKMAFFHVAREGWLKRYGFRPDVFRN